MAGVARVALLGLAVTACSTPMPSAPPIDSPAPSASPTPEPSQAHFDDGYVAFDYPADWITVERNVEVRHYEWIAVVLGTGEWSTNCVARPTASGNPTGGWCFADIFTVDPGEVVVKVYEITGPWPVAEKPPPDAMALQGGISASLLGGFQTNLWTLYLPGWMHPLVFDAHFPRPEAERFKAEVRRVVESVVVLAPH